MRRHGRTIFWQKQDIATYQPSAYFRITVHCIAVRTEEIYRDHKGRAWDEGEGTMDFRNG